MMEVTKVVTSVFVLCLSGPTFGYPFTRSNLFSADSANDLRGQGPSQHQLPSHLEDYLANYVQGNQQYPQYQPQQQQQQQPGYYQQQQQGPYQLPQTKLTAETLAALLPYLSSSSSSFSNLNGGDVGSAAASSSDYGAYPDYPEASQAYTDDEGTWYDDQAYNNQPTQQDEEQVALQLLLDHLNGRYSLDDLEAMEREAEMEENTESQLQSLMNKKVRRHETMNNFGQGDDQHLTIRRLRETEGVKRSGEKEKVEVHDDDIEKELKQESDTRENTKVDSQDTASGVISQDEKSSAHSTGLRKRSWGQTIGHLNFWGPNRYRSHRLHRGDIGHIKFMSPF